MRLQDVAIPDTDQFKPTADRVLIMDGDAACYEAASKYVKLDTAIRCVHMKILEAMFLTNCKKARVHITPAGCKKAGRLQIIGFKPYQGNRKDKEKPSILEPLRQNIQGLLKDKNIEVFAHYDVEADDAVVMDSYLYGKRGLVYSPDKDLRMVVEPYYDLDTGRVCTIDDRFGCIAISSTSTGLPHPRGQGLKFFWWQMLMGDTADNVRGLDKYQGKNIGMKGAYDLLNPIKDEITAAIVVLSAYREIDQNPFPEANMLWLLRSPADSFQAYLKELVPSMPEDLVEWLRECYKRKWRQ
nr:MAG TPA: Exodeoxyribonuclease [Caudoviricetes sp.]